MRIIRHWRHVPDDARGAVVAIGNFDGMHLGHQEVIAEARQIAGAEGAPLAVLTFEPHPRQVLGRLDGPFRLTPFRVKMREMSAAGVEVCFLARFDRAFAAQRPEQFVRNVLIDGVGAQFPALLSQFEALDAFHKDFAQRPNVGAYLNSSRRPAALFYGPNGKIFPRQ